MACNPAPNNKDPSNSCNKTLGLFSHVMDGMDVNEVNLPQLVCTGRFCNGNRLNQKLISIVTVSPLLTG
jgi:hypothetical protein